MMRHHRSAALALCLFFVCLLPAALGCGGSGVTFRYEDGRTADLLVQPQDGRVQLPADPEREGYAFKGWFTEPEGAGERITVDSAIAGKTTAYAFWRPRVDMADRNRIEIGGYNGVTEERTDKTTWETVYAKESDFALLAELGVDVIYLTYTQNSAPEVYNRYLDWLDKYGIQAYLRDGELNDRLEALAAELDFDDEQAVRAAVTEIKPYVERYDKRPFFKGNFLKDEPQPADMDLYIACAKLYQIAFPDHYMYVNLLPNYAGAFRNDLAYERYVLKFAKNFAVPYLEQDHYPIYTRTGKDGQTERYVASTDYYAGLYFPAGVARDYGRDYGNFIWTTKNLVAAEQRNYAPAVSDLRFEAFNAMAFGASHINLFCASTPPSYLGVGQGVIDNGEKTPGLWENTEQVLGEIRALSDVWPRYLWRDASYCYVGSGYGASMAIALSEVSYENWVQDLTAETDLLVGLFEEANGDGDAFFLVNNGEITAQRSTDVTFRVRGAKQVLAVVGTETRTLERNVAGVYALTLAPGQGAFVTVEK